MPQSAKFWDRIADQYSKQPIADEVTYQKKLEITRSYFRPDMNVLEFGCGTGSTAIAHSPHVKQILAIDISSKMIEIARSKAEAGDVENVTFTHATLNDFQISNQSLDAVLGMSILHLLGDKDEAINRVYKLIKPGGIFVSSTVCMGDSLKFLKYIAPIGYFFGLMPYIRIFSTQELKASLVNAGFVIEYCWQPGKNKGVFIVAKKPEESAHEL